MPSLSALPRLSGRVTYANVMSTLAVIFALTFGTAYAAGIGPNAVKSKHIASNAVKQRHISNGSVTGADIANSQVGSGKITDESITGDDIAPNAIESGELNADSVGSSEIKDQAVDSARIKNETITSIDVAPNGISSARMTEGVRNLLFNAGGIAHNQTYGDVTVTNDNWPGGAPSSGAAFNATWTQPPNTLDIVSGIARVEFPSSCSQTASTARGLDVKIVDAGGRVISASAAQRTGGENYNGNGFWAQQTELDGVGFRAPFGSDLASSPAAFIDYVHLPFEMSETVTGGSQATRTVRVYLKRSSPNCSPTVTDTRIFVIRYA